MPAKNLNTLRIPDSALTGIQDLLDSLKDTLQQHMPPLSDHERSEMTEMDADTIAFIRKAMDHAGNNPHMLPDYLKLADLQDDLRAVETLNALLRQLIALARNLDDAMTMTGSEAYHGALMVYNNARKGAMNNKPGATLILEDLSRHFPLSTRPKSLRQRHE